MCGRSGKILCLVICMCIVLSSLGYMYSDSAHGIVGRVINAQYYYYYYVNNFYKSCYINSHFFIFKHFLEKAVIEFFVVVMDSCVLREMLHYVTLCKTHHALR